MPGAHARFTPSSLGILMACAGSHELGRHYPDDEDSPAAREGTAAHEVAAALVATGELMPIGTLAANGVEITQEMAEGGHLYAEHVRSVLPRGVICVEQRVECFNLHPECWGTPDTYLFDGADLHVFDYKFGHGFVDEFENWQLLAYATGIWNGAAIRDKLHLHIVQPRNFSRRGPVRTWTLTAQQLDGYASRISARLRDVAEGGAEIGCVTGQHCHYCPARRGCEALTRAGQLACVTTGEAIPLDLTPEQLGVELAYLQRAAELLKYRIGGLEEQAEALLRVGARVPGYHLVSAPGRERWTAPDQVAALGQLWGVDLMKPAEPITPAQARKKLPDPAMVDTLATRTAALVLQQDSEKETRRIFWA